MQALEHGAASYVPKVLLNEKLIATDRRCAGRGQRQTQLRSTGRKHRPYRIRLDTGKRPGTVRSLCRAVPADRPRNGACVTIPTDSASAWHSKKRCSTRYCAAIWSWASSRRWTTAKNVGRRGASHAGTTAAIARSSLTGGSHVSIRIDPQQAVFVIRDDGKGFDTRNLPPRAISGRSTPNRDEVSS